MAPLSVSAVKPTLAARAGDASRQMHKHHYKPPARILANFIRIQLPVSVRFMLLRMLRSSQSTQIGKASLASHVAGCALANDITSHFRIIDTSSNLRRSHYTPRGVFMHACPHACGAMLHCMYLPMQHDTIPVPSPGTTLSLWCCQSSCQGAVGCRLSAACNSRTATAATTATRHTSQLAS